MLTSKSPLLAFALLIVGCAGNTIRSVPTLSASKIQAPAFTSLPTRELTVEVFDNRADPYREHSQQVVATVRDALAQALQQSHLTVRSEAPHTLTVRISDRDPVPGMRVKRESCVNVGGVLKMFGGRATAEAYGAACYEWRHLFGFSLGSDISRAYHAALGSMLAALDEQVRRFEAPLRQLEAQQLAGARTGL